MAQRQRMSRFRRILLAITAGCHAPFLVAAFEGFRRLGLHDGVAWAGALALGALGVWIFVGRMEKIANDAPRPFRGIVLFDLPYFIHWSACVWSVIPSLVYVVLEPLVDALRGLPVGPSPAFFFWTYVAGLVVCGYGVTFRRWFFETRRVQVPIRGLDPKLDGYTLVQLSDLHIGAMTPKWWGQRWVEAANALAADAVVVTGDLVTSGVEFHHDIAELIGGLRGKDGVFCAMGNHDYFGEGEPLISLIRARGPKVLRNEGIVLEREGAPLFLTAIDDTWTKRANIEQALSGRPSEDVPTVLLAHDPDPFPEIAKRNVQLTLSGHTHGGQVAMPFFARHINASKLAHKFHIGLYKDGDATLYVHPGLGTTGPPIRLGAAPCLVLFTLRAV